MQQQSIFIEDQGHQLHLRHIFAQPAGVPILMVHGAVENGRIFYTNSNKGLACFLAKQGFDVYVLDLRGRGKSTPLINAQADYGQYEAITHDIPLLINYIHNLTGQAMHLVSHSWGGVLVASCLARHNDIISKVRSNLCFGSKRRVTVGGFERYLKLDLFWNRLALKLAKRKGFFDAKKYRVGSDNETIESLKHSVAWVNEEKWHDPKDGFNYQGAAQQTTWPPTWHLTGVNDRLLGNAIDVKYFINESNTDAKFSLLSKQAGNVVDYDHIDILTHPEAVNDHFPEVATWLKQH